MSRRQKHNPQQSTSITNAGHRNRTHRPDEYREQEYENDATEMESPQIDPQLQYLFGWMYPFTYLGDNPQNTLNNPWENNVELFLLLERLKDPSFQIHYKVYFETQGIPSAEKLKLWAAAIVSQDLFEIKYLEGQPIPFWEGLTTEIDNRNNLHNMASLTPNVVNRSLVSFFQSFMGMNYWNEKSRDLTNFVIEYFRSCELCKVFPALLLTLPAIILSLLTFAISQFYDLLRLTLQNSFPLFFLFTHYYPLSTVPFYVTAVVTGAFSIGGTVLDILAGGCREEQDYEFMAIKERYSLLPFFVLKVVDAGLAKNFIFGLSNKITRVLLILGAILAQPTRLCFQYAKQDPRKINRFFKYFFTMLIPLLTTVPASAIIGVTVFTILAVKANFSAIACMTPAVMRLLACDTDKIKDCLGAILPKTISLLPLAGAIYFLGPSLVSLSWGGAAECFTNYLMLGYLCVGIMLFSGALNMAESCLTPKLFGSCVRANYRRSGVNQSPLFVAPRPVASPSFTAGIQLSQTLQQPQTRAQRQGDQAYGVQRPIGEQKFSAPDDALSDIQEESSQISELVV